MGKDERCYWKSDEKLTCKALEQHCNFLIIKSWCQYKDSDACVTQVRNVAESTKDELFKGMVIKPDSSDEIWNELQRVLPLKKKITIVPHAKL